jgi:hypothetical protein
MQLSELDMVDQYVYDTVHNLLERAIYFDTDIFSNFLILLAFLIWQIRDVGLLDFHDF